MSQLLFRRLAVRRMPGIPDGGFELRDLAPAVNVVFGPNASGKSTTSRAIESLLWPRSARVRETWLAGHFEMDGSAWEVELEGGRARFLRNGEAAALPHPIPAEARDRYLLSLPELLKADDLGFARAISLESAGGYDLRAAAQRLAPRTTPSRPKAQQEELRLARERLEEARSQQERLQVDSRSLRQDESSLAGRDRYEKRLTLLRRCEEYAERRQEVEASRADLERFDPLVARLRGDESERLAVLRQRLSEAESGALTAAGLAEGAAAEIERLGVAAGTVEGDVLGELTARVAAIERVESEIRTADRDAAKANSGVLSEARALGEGADPALLAGVGWEQLQALLVSTRKLEELRASRLTHHAEISLLAGAREAADRSALDRGAVLLEQWIRAAGEGDPALPRVRKLGVAATALLLAGGLLLALVHPAALALSLAGGLLLYLLLREGERPDTRPMHRAHYEEIELDEQPRTWEVDSVRATVRRLQERSAAAGIEQERVSRLARLQVKLGEVARQEKHERERFDALAAAAGIGRMDDDVQAIWLVERLAKWKTARAEADQAAAAQVAVWQHRSDALQRANERLAALGLPEAGDLPALRACVEGLGERARTHARVSADLRKARSDQKSARERAREARQEIEGILSTLELDAAAESRLEELCAERGAYLEARRRLDVVEGEWIRLEQPLLATPEFDPSLLEGAPGARLAEITEVEAHLQALDDLRDRVTTLKRDIEKAKEGHDVEDRLAEVERCEAALREVRDRDIRATIAAALVEHIDRATRNQHLPDVFHRARALFTRVTRGRYELRLGAGDAPEFLAFDTERERVQPLEELSSATRLQLLLAVRVAFVEQQEGGIRLPLLMDETLANSDDTRAAAIMDAVLELAAAGRQIFYFTAQPDEVQKWLAALEGRPEVEGRVFDLGKIRNLEHRLQLPAGAIAAASSSPIYPAPDGADHEEYGRVLLVPPIDVHAPVGALHLWYLEEDPRTLYRVISTLGAERWGAFQALVDQGGARLLEGATVERLELFGGLARVALQRMQVGRGRRVDRDALADSGAVTDRFMDKVAELCESCGGDARRLIAQLEARAVSGFRARSLDALREYLEAEGYYDAREVLPHGRIRLDVLAAATDALDAERVDPSAIERLLGRLTVGVSGAADREPEQGSLLMDPLL